MLRVLETDLRMTNGHLRMPFRFGIVTLTHCPHLFVRALLDIDGRRTWGIAADMLPSKWFTKDPNSIYADEVADMLAVIQSACAIAISAGAQANVFDLWERIYPAQLAWAGGRGYPPLLGGFGASLIERAMIDALCRDAAVPFSRILRENRLGIDLGKIHAELTGAQPRDLLPPAPLRQVAVRHTVGMTDPLSDADISDADRVDDGLPQSLEACIAAYGLSHFKIKLWGDLARDARRLRKVVRVVTRSARGPLAFTMDGNENFKTVAQFREFWTALTADPALAPLLKGLLFVEQPFHRSVALDAHGLHDFAAWPGRPPTIIDESDATLTSLRQALALGYAGTSHKNCKGVIKSIANAALLEYRRRTEPTRPFVLTGEDLINIGPVALTQDLCMAANLGIANVERNGHHYFKGLSLFDAKVQDAALAAHPDLYRRHKKGFVTANIAAGAMQIASVVDRAFGASTDFDPTQFTPASEWTYASLENPAPTS